MGIRISFRKVYGRPCLRGKYVVKAIACWESIREEECPLSIDAKLLQSLRKELRSTAKKTLELRIKRKVLEDSLDELLKQYSGSFLIDTIPVRVIVDSSLKEPLLIVTPDDYSRIIELEGFMFLESEVDEHRNRPD